MYKLAIFLGLAALIILAACNRKVMNQSTEVEEDAFEIVDTIYIEKEVVEEEVVQEEQPEVKPEDYVLFTIRRTPCYGKCPVYEASIYQSGLVKYKGQRNVDNIGLFEGRIDKGTVDELKSRAIAINYFDLSDFYPENKQSIPDLPVCITSMKLGEKEKTIYNNIDGPKELYALQDYVDALLKVLDLKVAE